MAGISPYLRLQRDDRLIALIRRGHHGAFEVLVRRYESRLLAFCRGMLGSSEDAEDVLQEVFAAAFKAILADDRPINAKPWLYRIARNRCLNHLRSPRALGQDSMDVFERHAGQTTSEAVEQREDLRLIVSDVHALPESQRTALLLREMEALSYDQIALTMDTTIPAVKSLLVRARVSLAEANEARSLSCDEVRLELGRAEEGLGKVSAPVRRHTRSCERCHAFRGELRRTSRALAAAYPVGALAVLHSLFTAKFGGGAVGAAGSGGAMGTGGAVGGAGVVGTTVSTLLAPMATKAVAGLAAAALLTAGAVEVEQLRKDNDARDRSARASLQARGDRAIPPAAEVESGSKATGVAVADARRESRKPDPSEARSSFAAPPAQVDERSRAQAGHDAADEDEQAVASSDALEVTPEDGAAVDPLVEGLPSADGATAADPAVPGSSHPTSGSASRDSVSPTTGTTTTVSSPGAEPVPPVGGKSADTTGDPDAAAGTTVTPVRAGHKGNRKKRRARRASKTRGASTPATSSATSSTDTHAEEPSPSAVAGSSTPEGRQALKNLQGVGR